MKIEANHIYHMDAIDFLRKLNDGSVDLIITSPPYSDCKRSSTKEIDDHYTHIPPGEYVQWMLPKSKEILRVLKDTGSFVLNIDTVNKNGQRSLYVYKLIIELVERLGYKLYDEYFWVKSTSVPAGGAATYNHPRRAVEYIFHLTKTLKPKIDTKKVVREYSDGFKERVKQVERHQIKGGYRRPSGHIFKAERIKESEAGGATPFNFIVSPNIPSADWFQRKLRDKKMLQHPASFPEVLPRFFILMLTDPGDLVLDPFLGSGTTAVVAKQLDRNFLGCDISKAYMEIARLRLDKYMFNKTIDDYVIRQETISKKH